MNFPEINETNDDGRAPRPNGDRDNILSVAVVDSNLERLNAVASVVCGLRTTARAPRVTTLPDAADSHLIARQGFNVVLVAVDKDQEAALKTIEALCRTGLATPMVYSPVTGDDLLIRCMRAGVREFLIYPFAAGVVEEAFSRAESRGLLAADAKKPAGRSFAFLGAKGGSGVTTAACNFAISMAQESKQKTLLIDLDLPLGDAALGLGIVGEFSTDDALRNPGRLDSSFLRTLVTEHSSGLFVLGAPGEFVRAEVASDAIDTLIEVACKSFDFVVVDAGSRWELAETRLFDMVSTIYLVTQIGIAELRNANRLITGCLQPYAHKLEIVLNRYKNEMFGIETEAIEKALTREAQWRIPNDFPAVREMQNTAVPLALKESNIQRAIRMMARIASGLPPEQQHKKRYAHLGMASGT